MRNNIAIIICYELKKFLTNKATYYYLLTVLTIIIFGWVFAVQTTLERDIFNGFMVTLFLSFSVTLLTLLTQCNQSLNDELESGSIYYDLLVTPKRPVYFLGKLVSQFICQIIFYEVVFLLMMLIFSLVNSIHVKLLISIFLLIPLVLFYLLLLWFLYYVCRLQKGTAILAVIIYLVHLFFSLEVKNSLCSNICNIFSVLKTVFALALSQSVSLEEIIKPYLLLIFICLIFILLLFSRLKKMDF